jgi:hypothetical protein
MIGQIGHVTDGNLVETGNKNPMPVRFYAGPDDEWSYTVTTPVINTNNVALKSAVAGKKNFLTAIQLKNTHATVGTEVVVKDGGTILWRGFLNANMVNGESYTFPTPLRTIVGNSLTFACITTGASVYVSAQGFQI